VYHQVAFGLIMITSVIRALWLVLRLPTNNQYKIFRTFACGFIIFVSGFGLWNIDNYYCQYLRDAREWLTDHNLGYLGHLTQLHGYWHLMTNYGAFVAFAPCILLCVSVKINSHAYDYDSSSWFPIVRSARSVAGVERKVKLEDSPEAEVDTPYKDDASIENGFVHN
jgi:dihydroceramidase